MQRAKNSTQSNYLAQAGKTYQVHLKAGVTARAEDKDWGVRAITNLTYAGEMLVNRTIESNDGRRIVELRHFEVCRNVKLLYEVEGVEIVFGPAGYLFLAALDYAAPGSGSGVVAVKPVAEAILGAGAQAVTDSQASKAFAHVDSLSGKRVRITYVDGEGVTAIEPVGCTLTADERDFVFATAVLSDCAIFPDLRIKPGGTWTVDGGEFIGLLDPSLRGTPRGSVTIVREPDQTPAGQAMARLRIDSGLIVIDRSDQRRQRRADPERPHPARGPSAVRSGGDVPCRGAAGAEAGGGGGRHATGGTGIVRLPSRKGAAPKCGPHHPRR